MLTSLSAILAFLGLLCLGAALVHYLESKPRRRITGRYGAHLTRIAELVENEDPLSPAPFVDAVPTPIVTEYLCPHCGKPMLPEQKLYHVGLRPIGHSRCVLNPPSGPRSAA